MKIFKTFFCNQICDSHWKERSNCKKSGKDCIGLKQVKQHIKRIINRSRKAGRQND